MWPSFDTSGTETEYEWSQHDTIWVNWYPTQIKTKCDLSRENVPYGIRSNGRTHGMWTDDKRIEKPFKTDAVNGWTASEKFRTVEVERLNG